MKKIIVFLLSTVAVICMVFGITSLTSKRSFVRAETVSGITPTLSETKLLKSTDGTMMLLATGINDFQDCYECGYVTEGLQAVTYNTAKYYSSISINDGAKTWTSEDIFGVEYGGMIVWEVKNLSTETSFKAYVKVGERIDGVLYPTEPETVVYGDERSLESVVDISADSTGIILPSELDNFASSGKALTFEYKATGSSSGTDTVVFSLWTEDGTHRLTNIFSIDVESCILMADTTGNIAVDSPTGKVEDLGDDWHRVTINCSDMPINTAESADGTETIGLLFFNTVNHPIIVANVGFVDEDVHIGAYNFSTIASNYDFGPSPSTSGVALDKVIILDVKFATAGNFNFYLNEYWNPRYCGPFTVTSAGAVSGNGASIESIDDGWYRVRINLGKASKGGNPTFISRVNIQDGTATGYVKYIGYEEPDIHEDKVEFAAGTAKDYYFGASPSTSGVELDKIIVLDVKFATAGNFNFYLNEYWFGRWCGPFTLTSAGALSGTGASSCEDTGDGWYRIKIDLASANKSGTLPAFVSRVNILNTTTASGYVMYMGYEEPEIIEPTIYTPKAGDFIDLPETITNYTTSSKYLTFKIKPEDPASSGTIQMKLSDGSAMSYGIRIVFNSNSAPTNSRACASIEDIGDGWYLITTQTGAQISGSAFNATKLKFEAYSGYPTFYLKDLEIH